MSSAANTLIVPIHLDAICVSPLTPQEDNNSGFMPATLQNLDGLPFHGDAKSPQVAAVSQHFHSPPFAAGSLETGVHLHWALPDALTHGRHVHQVTDDARNEMRCLGVSAEVVEAVQQGSDPGQLFTTEEQLLDHLQQLLPPPSLAAYQELIVQATGRFDFPRVPNRWLLVRLITDAQDKNPQLASWVIESDFLSNDETYAGHTVVPSPNGISDQPPWRYMGRARTLQQDKAWQEDLSAIRYPDLTALGYGELSFAAYYPNCRTVFGHHETVDELAATAYSPGTHRLTYAVIGWHSDPTNDPLYASQDVLKTLADLAWRVNGAGEPQRSVYYGIVHDVQWDASRPQNLYAADVTEPIELAVGNSAAEALAAYLSRHTPPSESQDGGRSISAETLIEALQLDLLGEIHLAEGDFEQLEHALHERAFRAHPGGSEWIIGKTLATHDGTQTSAQHFEQQAQTGAFTPLPLDPEIADDLGALNVLQRDYDSLQFETRERRWQLFADWHESMLIAYPGLSSNHQQLQQESLVNAYHNLVTKGVTKLESSFADLAANAETIITDASQLQDKIAPDYTLRRVAAARFWQPNDPTLLLVGSDVDPSIRYGADKLFGEGGQLACRMGTDLIATLGSGAIATEALTLPKMENVQGIDSSFFKSLLVEVLLINRYFAGPAETLQSAQIAAKSIPAAIALNRWGNAAHSGRNPWHPLMLHWEIDPALLDHSANDNGANDNRRDVNELVHANATLLPHALDLAYNDDATATVDESKPYQGIVILTPHATKSLVSQLQRLLPDGLDETLKQDLERLPILSQVISGFNDSLLMRAQQNQFRVEDPYDPQKVAPPGLNIAIDPPLWKKVQAAVGRMNNAAPLPNSRYTPIRAGFAKIKRLWLVDAFGQYKAFEGDALPPAIVPSTMRPPAALRGNLDLAFVPRVVQPSRLFMRWVAADNSARFMNAHPDTTPICGWVLPNHLDNSLMIYDNSGQMLGSLRASDSPADRWQGAPGVTPAPTSENPTLQKMVAYLQTFDKNAFTNYLQAIEQVLLTIEPPTYREHDALSVLMGRPLALAQVHLTAELKGLPAADQSYETLTQLINTQAQGSNAAPNSNAAPEKLRTHHNFTEIKLPVRLGDVVTERDGLVCFFSETHDAFSAYHLEVDAEGNHVRDDGDDLWLKLSTRDQENTLTIPLLLDPRAKLHATTGFLPVQSLLIPPEYYNEVLERMALTLLVNPLLSSATQLTLPLPAETTHSWEWYDPLHGWMTELTPSDDRAHLDGALQQIREGWLRMRPYAPDTVNSNDSKKPADTQV